MRLWVRMTPASRVVVAITVCLALVACGSGDDVDLADDAAATETGDDTAGPASEAEGDGVPEDGADDARDGGDDAPWAQGEFDRTQLPDGVPDSIWLPSTMRLTSADDDDDQFAFAITGRVPGDTPDALARTFVERLSAAGWDHQGERSDSVGTDHLFSDGTYDLLVRVAEPPPSSSAMLVWVQATTP